MRGPLTPVTGVTRVWRRETDITRRAAKKVQDTHTVLARLIDFTHSTHDTALEETTAKIDIQVIHYLCNSLFLFVLKVEQVWLARDADYCLLLL